MDYLEEINHKVQEQLKLKSKEVILTSLQTLVNKHNELCGCNYCVLLKEYIELKIQNTRLKRLYKRGAIITPIFIETDSKLSELKVAKDLLKKL